MDTSALKHLATDGGARAAQVRMRIANLRVWPSMINLLEALNHGNTEKREKILRLLEEWLGEEFLLPWPPEILKSAGIAALEGVGEFVVPTKHLFLRDLHKLDDDAHVEARKFLSDLEGAFKEAHKDSGPALRKVIKARGLRDQLQDAKVFIEEVWGSEDNMRHQAQLIWRAVGLEGSAPSDIWRSSEPWKVMLEALGAAIFFRSVRVEAQGNPAGLSDIFQLSYLTMHTRSRILVTDDKSMRETAEAVMVGRYSNVRIMSGAEFFAP